MCHGAPPIRHWPCHVPRTKDRTMGRATDCSDIIGWLLLRIQIGCVCWVLGVMWNNRMATWVVPLGENSKSHSMPIVAKVAQAWHHT